MGRGRNPYEQVWFTVELTPDATNIPAIAECWEESDHFHGYNDAGREVWTFGCERRNQPGVEQGLRVHWNTYHLRSGRSPDPRNPIVDRETPSRVRPDFPTAAQRAAAAAADGRA